MPIIIIIIILFAIRQLQVIPQTFYSTSHFTMLMLLIHTYYTPCVDYSPYQANVFSNVVMCLTPHVCKSSPLEGGVLSNRELLPSWLYSTTADFAKYHTRVWFRLLSLA